MEKNDDLIKFAEINHLLDTRFEDVVLLWNKDLDDLYKDSLLDTIVYA